MTADRTEAREESLGAGGRPRGSPEAEHAIIGNSIRIQGEVTGDEDLTIQGHVDGSVELDQHSVTVGPDGEVKADISARVIAVEGRVDGDLTADEQVVVASSARVEGDISAPRVVLKDGAHFRGGIDMSDRTGRRGSGTVETSTTAGPAADAGGSPLTSDDESSGDEDAGDGDAGEETA